jgi:ribosome modulation factor
MTSLRLVLDIPAWDAGYAAGAAGEPLDSCPHPPATRESLSWHSGYIEGRAKCRTLGE